MKIKDVHHIAINTKNIDESINFYNKMFGMKVESEADLGEFKLVYLKIKENSYLELFDLRGACVTGRNEDARQGLRHIALDVDDIEAWSARLKEKGAKIILEVCTVSQINKKCMLIEDPNGVVIELCEDAK